MMELTRSLGPDKRPPSEQNRNLQTKIGYLAAYINKNVAEIRAASSKSAAVSKIINAIIKMDQMTL